MSEWKLLLDDLAKMAVSTFGLADGVRRDGADKIRLRFEKLAKKMDLVSRQEFEVVKAMAARARAEHEHLKARLDKLEKSGKLSKTSAGKKTGSAKRAKKSK